MVGIIGLIVIAWLASAILRAAKETKRNQKIAQLNREAAQTKLQQDLMAQEWKRAQASAKAEMARLVKLEKEQERQRKEQERQAIQLQKHEERLMKLEQRMERAEREIAHYSPILEEMKAEYEALDNRIWYYQTKGLPCSGLIDKRQKLSEKLYRIDTKVFKAQQDIDFCNKQMSA